MLSRGAASPRPRSRSSIRWPLPTETLLFGLLALQNGLIDQSQLVAAFHAWTRDKGRPMADFLRRAR